MVLLGGQLLLLKWVIQMLPFQPSTSLHPINVWGLWEGFVGVFCDVCFGAAHADGISSKLGLAKKAVPVKNTRNIGKLDLKLNVALPKIDVDPETYEVRADGELLTCQPADEVSMAQRYFMF